MTFLQNAKTEPAIEEGKRKSLSSPNWLVGLFCLGLGIAIGARLAAFWQINWDWLAYPFWRPGSEGLILDETLRVREGLPIYAPITQTSFISGPYPPVFYYLSAFLINFTGPGLLAGRILAFGSALLCAALVGWLVCLESRSWLVSLLFGPLLLLTSPFLIWASRNRGDILMVAFNLAGLVCVANYNSYRQVSLNRPKRASKKFFSKSFNLLLFSIILFSLGFYTKQTGLAAPLASLVWLGTINWRIGLRYVLGLLGGLLGPFLGLELVTRHEFYRHIISYHALPWSWAGFENWLGVFVGDNSVLVVVTLGFIVTRLGYWLYQALIKGSILRNPSAMARPPLAVWFGLFSLASLVTTGVAGADHNHLLLPVAAVCVNAGVAVGKCLKLALITPSASQKLSWNIAACILLLLVTVQLWFGWDNMLKNYAFDLKSRLSYAEQTQMSRIISYVKTINGPILSEEVALPALAGKENQVEYNDVYTMGLLAQAGKWNSTGLAAQVSQKHFALILVPFDLTSERAANHKIWPPDVLQAIKQNYQVKFRDIWFVYEPKS